MKSMMNGVNSALRLPSNQVDVVATDVARDSVIAGPRAPFTRDSILVMQRTLGNRVVNRLLAEQAQRAGAESKSGALGVVQRKARGASGKARGASVRPEMMWMWPPEIYPEMPVEDIEEADCTVGNDVGRSLRPPTCQSPRDDADLVRTAEALTKLPSALASCGGGTKLPPVVQTKMEHAFGMSLSGVRVYESSAAASTGARAFTRGTDIHFAPGEYSPYSQNGQQTLGHELTHIAQQATGRVAPTIQWAGLSISNDRSLEHEADTMGAKAARGEPVHGSAPGASDARPAVDRGCASQYAATVSPGLVQMLARPQLEAVLKWLEDKKRNMRLQDNKEVEWVNVKERAIQAATEAQTESAAKSAIENIINEFWGTPSPQQGDMYLAKREQRRPKMINLAKTDREIKTNCSLVAVAAAMNKTVVEVLNDLGFGKNNYDSDSDNSVDGADVDNESKHDDDGDDMPYVPVLEMAFLGPENVKKYNQVGSMLDKYAERLLEKEKEHADRFLANDERFQSILATVKKDRFQEGDVDNDTWKKQEEELRRGFRLMYIKRKYSVDSNAIEDRMIDYILDRHDKGVRVKKIGSKDAPYGIKEGIELMKGCPPGTEFVVLLQAVDKSKDRHELHYVYANNLGGSVHFLDYQPFSLYGTSNGPNYSRNQPPPPPFPTGIVVPYGLISCIAIETNAQGCQDDLQGALVGGDGGDHVNVDGDVDATTRADVGSGADVNVAVGGSTNANASGGSVVVRGRFLVSSAFFAANDESSSSAGNENSESRGSGECNEADDEDRGLYGPLDDEPPGQGPRDEIC